MKSYKGIVLTGANSSVRLTQDAKEKLSVIAARKKTTLGTAASQIIVHYVQNSYDYDVSNPIRFQAILDLLSNVNTVVSKTMGQTSRTEDFIKGLLREEHAHQLPSAVDVFSEPGAQEENTSLPDQKTTEALSIVSRLLSTASSVNDFEGKAVMQIRIPMTEFHRLKAQYDNLCM